MTALIAGCIFCLGASADVLETYEGTETWFSRGLLRGAMRRGAR